jgi:four helix bundle protein
MLIVESKALEMVRVVGTLLPRIGRGSRALADQLDRASLSVPLNVAEGLRSQGGHRAARLHTALGSARESVMALRIAEARGYVGARDIEVPLGLLDEVCAMSWRLAERGAR